MWRIYKMEYHSAIKRNNIVPLTDTVIQREIRKKKKLYINTNMWHLENGINKPICKAGAETQV